MFQTAVPVTKIKGAMATYIDRNILTRIYQNSPFTSAEAGKVQ